MEYLPYQLLLLVAGGFIYIITPGPGFLAVITIVSEQNRRAGFRFITGMMIGSMFWLVITFGSLIETEHLPRGLFNLLTFLCASYLLYLGTKLIASGLRKTSRQTFYTPFRDGLVLSVLNPKAYPVMLSVFGGLSMHNKDMLDWAIFNITFLFAVAGFALGYVFVVLLASTPLIRGAYMRNLGHVSLLFGLIFYGFAANLLAGLVYVP